MDAQHSELDALFVYNTTLIKIYLTLMSQILAGYNADICWAWLWLQIQRNIDLGTDAAALPFVLSSAPSTDADLYINPRPEGNESSVTNAFSIQCKLTTDELPAPDKLKLLYHVSKLIGVYRLCIPPSVAPNIFANVHKEGHPGFSCCYKIIARSWFIYGLTKLL